MTVEGRVALGAAILIVAIGGIMWALNSHDRTIAAINEETRKLQFEQLRIRAEGHTLTPRQEKLVKQISDTAVLNHERVLDSLLDLATDDRLDSAYRRRHSRH